MKSQIIQLETHDDVISIKDKLGWARASRIILVLPRRANLLRQKIDFTLLKRHSQKLGIQLALITNDPLTRSLAHEAGIATFSSTTQALKRSWLSSSKRNHQNHASEMFHERFLDLQREILSRRSSRPARLMNHLNRLLSFLLGVLGVLSLAVVILPAAKISFTPPLTTQSLTLNMIASPTVEQPRASGEFPITYLSINASITKSTKATGFTKLPLEFAQGEVLFTNLTDQQIIIPKGTVVRTTQTELHRYQTTSESTLPAGSGSTVIVPVRAILPGASENIPPEAIQAVEGSLGLQIAVSNPETITGGSDKTITSPSQDDLQQLYRLTYQELLGQVSRQIHSQLQAGDILLAEEPHQVKILRKEFHPAAGSPSETVELSLEIEAVFTLVSSEHLQTVGINLLDASIPPDFLPINNTFNAECQQLAPTTAQDEFSCKLTISRAIKPKPNEDVIRRTIAGKKLDWSVKYIQHTLSLQSPPEITVSPSWFPFLPLLPFRIDIIS